MTEFIPLIVDISSIMFSVTALYFTWRIYSRENTINNENFIYQKKFDSHNKLFVFAVEYLNKAEDIFILLKSLAKKETEYAKNELDNTFDSFDLLEERLELELFKHSLILPEKVLDEYLSLINDKSPWSDITNVQNWNDLIKHCYDKLDNIHEATTKDLHIHELSRKMVSRMGKSKNTRNKPSVNDLK